MARAPDAAGLGAPAVLKYLPPDLDLEAAIGLEIGHGATEPDAKSFLHEWFRTRKLEPDHDPPLYGTRVEGIHETSSCAGPPLAIPRTTLTGPLLT